MSITRQSDRFDKVLIKLDEMIESAQQQLDEAERIMESLRGEEEYEDQFNYAYEKVLDATSNLHRFTGMKEWMNSVGD